LIKVVSAWPKLLHMDYRWMAIMFFAEVASFVCAIWLLRLLLRTTQWFNVVAALLVGNAVTNVLPAGDVAGAGVQYQMLAIGGIDADQAAGGLAASSIIGLAGLLMLPVFALPALLGGEPVSPGLAHAAFLGMGGFVLIVGFSAVLLTTDIVLVKFANGLQWLLNKIPRRKSRTEGLAQRLREQRDMVRSDLGQRWWQAALMIGGRIGLDYVALLAALRATGARPNPSLVLLAYAATAVIALVPLTPGGLGIVEASLSGLLVLAGVPSANAIIATLAYRLVTYWLPIFVGGGIYIEFRRRHGPVKLGAANRPSSSQDQSA
jgi:uncharacterized protein (TIRG00374 family)